MARRKRRGLRGLGSPLTTAVSKCAAYEVGDKKRGYNTAGMRSRMYTCVNDELRSMSFEHGSTAPSDMYKDSQIKRGIAAGMRAKGLVDDSVMTKVQRRRWAAGRPSLAGSRRKRRRR